MFTPKYDSSGGGGTNIPEQDIDVGRLDLSTWGKKEAKKAKKAKKKQLFLGPHPEECISLAVNTDCYVERSIGTNECMYVYVRISTAQRACRPCSTSVPASLKIFSNPRSRS